MLSLRNKTILGTAVIEGILLVILILIATRFVTESLDDGLKKRSDITTKLFASMTKDAVLSYDLASLESIVGEVMQTPDIEYARIVDPIGQVFAEGGTINGTLQDFTLDKSLSDVDDDVFDSEALISENGNVYARVQIGIATSRIQATLAQVTHWTIAIALTEMLLVAMFSWILGSYLTSQLYKLKSATKLVEESVGTGDFEKAKTDIKTKDEIGEVAYSFNSLVDKLQQQDIKNKDYEQQLISFNKDLENTVTERTQELMVKNKALLKTNLDLNKAQQHIVQSEKLASMGQLAAGLAHEINNPISYVTSNLGSLKHYLNIYQQVILKTVQLLEVEEQPVKKQLLLEIESEIQDQDVVFVSQDMESLLTEMEEGLQRVSDIVQSMTVFSRTNSNDKLQSFNLNDCIESTFKMVNKQISETADLFLELSDVPDVYINVGKINQVIINILINASQAMKTRGIIKVISKIQDNCIQVKIMDNGCGIPEFQLSKIFDPFFTTKKEGEGTGLGLAISYDIMKEHGGSLEVESEVDKGTTVTLNFPVKDTVIH